jgi:hypothetical protein
LQIAENARFEIENALVSSETVTVYPVERTNFPVPQFPTGQSLHSPEFPRSELRSSKRIRKATARLVPHRAFRSASKQTLWDLFLI